MSIRLLFLAVACIAVSGMPGVLLGRRSSLGQWFAAVANVVGSLIGAVGLIIHFGAKFSQPDNLILPWGLPIGHFAVGVDALSAVFLIPMLLISALGSIYGLSYWKQAEHPGNGRKLRLFWGLMTAGMMLVVLATDGVTFLMAWEIMALAAFFLVATEDKKHAVREAGWVYLVATHVGTLCLFALFALFRYAGGSFDLWSIASWPHAWVPTAVFVLGCVGFGLKAGIMPLHVWLPGAHANAPSHVSAILSGVLLKTGVYGLIRVGAMLPHPPVWWGATLLAAGAVSGIVGIAFAVSQQDFKRLLAYSSIENVGIMVMGIGLALVGRAVSRNDLIYLGLAGALLHVLNHSLFKPLLFMGAGSLLHAVHTRQIDLLGGLGKRMPRTFVLFAIGAVAICGLPPLNGFVSELLIYLGLFRALIPGDGRTCVWASLAAPALAIIGALAVGGFVKLLGAVFTGGPRTSRGQHAHDPSAFMLAPMAVLAGLCIAIGLFPAALARLLERAVLVWQPQTSAEVPSPWSLVPWHWMTVASISIIVAASLAAVALRRWFRYDQATSAGTWDCGYARPTNRMQYTGSSLTDMITGFFAWVLVPRKLWQGLRVIFSSPQIFSSEVPDVVLDRGLFPGFRFIVRVLAYARPIQSGPVQVYLVYVLAILLALLLFAR